MGVASGDLTALPNTHPAHIPTFWLFLVEGDTFGVSKATDDGRRVSHTGTALPVSQVQGLGRVLKHDEQFDEEVM